MIKPLSRIVEECPVCGRPVEICCEHFGRRLVCQHCGGRFVATEEGIETPEWMQRYQSVLQAADQWLKVSAQRPKNFPSSREENRRRLHLLRLVCAAANSKEQCRRHVVLE